jgi:hypothetical protein
MTEQQSTMTPTSARFEPQFRDKKLLGDMYLCILVKGVLPSGQRGYCYFGIFADTFVNFLNRLDLEKPFNPKDIKAIVLARSTGEPSCEIREFMRMKFSFAEATTVLEISRNK